MVAKSWHEVHKSLLNLNMASAVLVEVVPFKPLYEPISLETLDRFFCEFLHHFLHPRIIISQL